MISESRSAILLDGEGHEPVRALVRGLALLSAVLDADEAPTLTDLAQRTELHKATTARLLATLVRCGFVAVEPEQTRYTLGPQLARWLRTPAMESLLSRHALPIMNSLREASGETVALYVSAWPDRVCIECAPSHHPIRRHHDVGEVAPLSRGAPGRAFLMGMSDTQVSRALEARPLTHATDMSIVDRDEYLRLLSAERANGVAISLGENFEGMNGIAVPVIRRAGESPIAVINVSGPSFRWTEERIRTFAPILKRLTSDLPALLDPTSEA